MEHTPVYLFRNGLSPSGKSTMEKRWRIKPVIQELICLAAHTARQTILSNQPSLSLRISPQQGSVSLIHGYVNDWQAADISTN